MSSSPCCANHVDPGRVLLKHGSARIHQKTDLNDVFQMSVHSDLTICTIIISNIVSWHKMAFNSHRRT